MTKGASRAGSTITSFVALVGLFGALPLALVAASRARFGSPNPLAGVDAPWRWTASEVGDALAEPLRDDAVINLIIRSSISIAWIAIAVVAVSTVAEVAHMVRHRGLPTPHVRGLGWAQRIARFIAVGLIAILPSIESVHAASTASLSLHLSDARAGSGLSIEDALPGGSRMTYAPAEVDEPVGSTASSAVHVVRQGESVWQIAARLAGHDDARTLELADAILDANLGRTMADGHRFANPALVQPGWELIIPTGAPGTEHAGTRHDLAGAGTRSPGVETTVDQTGETERSDDDHVTHVVVEGDTLSGIADEVLGDGDRWDEIFAENEGHTMLDQRVFDDPNLIVPGWELEIPTGDIDDGDIDDGDIDGGDIDIDIDFDDGAADDVPLDVAVAYDAPDPYVPPVPTAAPPSPSSVPAVADAPTPGESSTTPSTTDISTTTSSADGVPPPNEPDIAVPGATTEASIPPPTAAPSTTTPDSTTPDGTATSTAPESTTSTSTTTTPTSANPDGAATTSSTFPPTTSETTAGPDSPAVSPTIPPTPSPTSTTSTTSTTVPAFVDPGDSGAPDTDLPESPAAPSPIRIEHAGMLAIGIVTLVGVRRRRRLRAAAPRARVPIPPADVAATERRLRATHAGEGTARLDIALRAAAHRLAETGARIGWVRTADDGHLTLRLTAPGRLEAPWVGDGVRWELPSSVPIELLAADARRSDHPCHALVSIGNDSNGDALLVDLEAAVVTAVEARPEQADEIVRAIAAALASSLSAEVAHIVTASLGTRCLLGHPNAQHESRPDRVIEAARAFAGTTIANERPTFDLRARRTGGEMWEPAIALFASADRAAEHLDVDDLPPPGHGLAVVAAVTPGELPGSVLRLVARADRWELLAFGDRIEIAPIGISTDDLDEITAVLADAEAPVISEPSNHVGAPTGTPLDVPFEPVDHEIVVGLLGGVTIERRDGEPGVFERSKTVELIAWLATHRDRATRSAARTALWELDVRDATFANVVSEARRALARLVAPPDGEEWLARTLNEALPLHDLVITDADLVRQRLEHARLAAPSHAIDVLRPAVELIREMPFAGTSYLWPDADGITSDLVLLATTVTSELAAHALSIGDTETVFWSTGRGLRVLPGHEELIALRMRAHARNGDLAGVRSEWASYERVIVADAWSDGEPAPKLLELRRELLSPGQ